MGETIVFTSGKGGVGKTTTIANIGARLSQLDKKVIMLDTDMGLRNLDVVMGLEDHINYNLLDLLDNKCRLQQAVIKDRRFPNLYMIPASLKTVKLEPYEESFFQLIQQIKKEYDYCFIDCPAGLDQGFRFATSVADRGIILTTPHISAIKDASRVLQRLTAAGFPRIELIINEYDEKLVRKKYTLSQKDIADLLDIPILGVVYHDKKIIASQNKGTPVITMRTKATECYHLLSQKMISVVTPSEGACIYDFS